MSWPLNTCHFVLTNVILQLYHPQFGLIFFLFFSRGRTPAHLVTQSYFDLPHVNMEGKVEDTSISEASSALSSTQITPELRKMHIKDAKWEVCADAQQGRYLVAKEDIAAGEIVLQELPYAFVPFEGPEGQVRLIKIVDFGNCTSRPFSPLNRSNRSFMALSLI